MTGYRPDVVTFPPPPPVPPSARPGFPWKVAFGSLFIGMVLGFGIGSTGREDPKPEAVAISTTTTTTLTTVAEDPREFSPAELGLADDISKIYPGVATKHLVDWARYTCNDIGTVDASTLLRRVQFRFAGGDRPDPTEGQANGILALIQASGVCG